jgi:diacylglycerol kinase (ATP)
MRKAALLYNPDSGGSKQRQKDLHSALGVLTGGGVEAELIPTESREHASEETQRAISAGCDTIFACGGDGTVNNVAQILANSPVALGILPIGTANALAHDLRIPRNLTAAAKAALEGTPRRIALGRVSCPDLKGRPSERYFVITAGIGVDAHLFYKLQTGAKQKLGMAAYYAKAWHMWFSYPMTRFSAEYAESGSGLIKKANVTELLAVRIRDFGGVIRELAPGASLDRNDLRLILCLTGSRLTYLAYVTKSLLGASWKFRGVELAFAQKVSCNYAENSASGKKSNIYVEADGELIGSLPAEITVVPDALTLLAPSR